MGWAGGPAKAKALRQEHCGQVASKGEGDVDEVRDRNKDLIFHSEQEKKSTEGCK